MRNDSPDSVFHVFHLHLQFYVFCGKTLIMSFVSAITKLLKNLLRLIGKILIVVVDFEVFYCSVFMAIGYI